MTDQKLQELHILNFFFTVNRFASSVELQDDFYNSGIGKYDGKTFENILSNGYLETSKENGRFIYKLNTNGEKRLNRLKIELQDADEKKYQMIFHIQGDISNSVLGQSRDNDFIKPTVQNTTNNTPANPPKRSWVEITAWIVGIISGLLLIWEFLIKK